MNNENKFKQVMLLLATTYDKTLTPEQAQAYWSALGKYNPEFLQVAAQGHIENPQDGKFFPKPAHLIGRINELMADQKRRAYFIEQETKLLEKKPKTAEQIEIGMAAIKKMKESL